MSGHSVELEAVSKRYFVGEHVGRGQNVRDLVAGYVRHRGRPPVEEVWSLRDVTLAVPTGQALGIVGRNGAGKSTLLKVIGRITAPTSGRSRTRGRVSSLLEVGTGFHPELTGRENIYLNGALLGLTKRDIERQLEQIIDFAGATVARFVDTPVKRYSSGMYLRLGFAIAAHLETEILLVDEVLAVGDMEFQQRCLGRMSEIEREGRTVLFVSHHLDSIRRLCDQAVWLDEGRVHAVGAAPQVIERYVASTHAGEAIRAYPHGPGAVSLAEVAVLGRDGRPQPVLPRESAFGLKIVFRVNEIVPGLDLSAVITDLEGRAILDEAWSDRRRHHRIEPGTYMARLSIPPVLNTGDYAVSIWMGSSHEDYVWEDQAIQFRLEGDSANRPRRVLNLGLSGEVDAVNAPVSGALTPAESLPT
jgi:ABC-type polysaccharide/polyol phosphate transport system ATPase subunit